MTLHRFMDANADYLIENHAAGRTVAELAREFGVTDKVVKRVLQKNGVEPRKSTARDDVDEQGIIDTYVSGVSENATAQRFNVSRPVVERVLRYAGVSRRSQGESEALKWSQMTPAQRAQQTASAHEAVRGMSRTTEELIQRAQTREAKGELASEYEAMLYDALVARGLSPVIQKAIGIYNCDLAIDSVAVEVWAGGFHFYGHHAALHRKRISNILDAGYHVIVTWFDNGLGFSPDCADDVVRFCEFSRANPSAVRQYRMIRRGHELLAACSAESDQIPLKPAYGGRLDF